MQWFVTLFPYVPTAARNLDFGPTPLLGKPSNGKTLAKLGFFTVQRLGHGEPKVKQKGLHHFRWN
jgi:hypothetical protein